VVVVFGATGRTGRTLVDLLCARGLPVRAVVRPEVSWPADSISPTLRTARAKLTRSGEVRRCLDDATSIVYLAGSRPSLTIGTAALVQDYASFMNCVDAARERGIMGSFIYVGVDQRPPRGLAERIVERTRSRWTSYKVACERSLVRTPLHYLVLRVRALSDASTAATRIRFGASPGSSEIADPIPRAALAALIAGAVVRGHTPRTTTTLVTSRIGYTLSQAVAMLVELAPDGSEIAESPGVLEPARRTAPQSIK
jgi:uncharacterized protein YbjT (DUF2867 family)